ncbi:hypothetical protein GN958_ATG22485 [Phytophthora infestans]|uniref:Uncharacterized protein n=1 Tax=Phytophthora infestans TaxID=4787 RepID=A0A8S9TNF8_PHYIN|nr:hypothetical protein GN958_ATG22485 [Phytophthora infestans]
MCAILAAYARVHIGLVICVKKESWTHPHQDYAVKHAKMQLYVYSPCYAITRSECIPYRDNDTVPALEQYAPGWCALLELTSDHPRRIAMRTAFVQLKNKCETVRAWMNMYKDDELLAQSSDTQV